MNNTPFFDTSRLFAWKQIYPTEWEKIASDILSTYIDVSKPYHNNSLRCYMEKDLEKLEKVVRDFRSASCDIGATLLHECLSEMEDSIKRGDLEKFGENLPTLNRVYFQTLDEMKKMLAFLKLDAVKNVA